VVALHVRQARSQIRIQIHIQIHIRKYINKPGILYTEGLIWQTEETLKYFFLIGNNY
jgi:hypothetical protein